MELWPIDWGSDWVAKAVGTKLRLWSFIAIIVAYLLLVHLTHYHWIFVGVNFPAVMLGSILIIALFAMRGHYKKTQRSENSNS